MADSKLRDKSSVTSIDNTAILYIVKDPGGTPSDGKITKAELLSLIQDVEIKDYSETKTAPESSSGTLILDIENGNVFEVELDENVTTLTISNPPASGKAGSFTLILKQDATGGRSFTWPSSVDWAGGSAPTLTTDASAVDILVFVTTDGGTTWYGMLAGADFS